MSRTVAEILKEKNGYQRFDNRRKPMDKQKAVSKAVNLVGLIAVAFALSGKQEQAEQLNQISQTIPVTVDQVVGLVGALASALSIPLISLRGLFKK